MLIPLSEIQRIRDALARLPERHTSNIVRQLFRQVVALYENSCKQVHKQ